MSKGGIQHHKPNCQCACCFAKRTENSIFKGRHHTKEAKEKNRQSHLGEKNSCYKEKVPIICQECGKTKYVIPSRIKQKYCSLECNYSAGKSQETKDKIGKGNKGKTAGEKNPRYGKFKEESTNWKGDDVGYAGIHAWVASILGKPTKCEHCPKDGLTGKDIHWANKDHKYKRNLDDWMRLCPNCHRKYDKEHGLRK